MLACAPRQSKVIYFSANRRKAEKEVLGFLFWSDSHTHKNLYVCSSGLRGQFQLCCSVSSSVLLLVSPHSWGAALSPSSPPSPFHLLLGVCLSLLPSFLRMMWPQICNCVTKWMISAGTCLHLLITCVDIFQELCFPEALREVWREEPDVLWQWEGTKNIHIVSLSHFIVASSNHLLIAWGRLVKEVFERGVWWRSALLPWVWTVRFYALRLCSLQTPVIQTLFRDGWC